MKVVRRRPALMAFVRAHLHCLSPKERAVLDGCGSVRTAMLQQMKVGLKLNAAYASVWREVSSRPLTTVALDDAPDVDRDMLTTLVFSEEDV